MRYWRSIQSNAEQSRCLEISSYCRTGAGLSFPFAWLSLQYGLPYSAALHTDIRAKRVSERYLGGKNGPRQDQRGSLSVLGPSLNFAGPLGLHITISHSRAVRGADRPGQADVTPGGRPRPSRRAPRAWALTLFVNLTGPTIETHANFNRFCWSKL